MIHFDFETRYQDENVVGSAISRREGVLFAIFVHAGLFLALLFGPRLALFQPSPEELERRRALAEQQAQQQQRMVFVQPMVDLKALQPPERADRSDMDRKAQAPERPPNPSNALPYMRGNSPERNEAVQGERARGPDVPSPPAPPTRTPPQTQPESTEARILPPADDGFPRPTDQPRTAAARPGGSLGEALRNLQRYVQNQSFDNPQGGQNDPGATIQFDSKGVEFGPWIRRFVAQVKRNWFIPLSAMSFRGHVVLQFNIWKDGHITDINVVQPSSIESFNTAAYNAILSSNPVDPLPPEYPSEKAFFTVTFYYNEMPPGN